MARKITHLQRMRAKAMRLSLNIFCADPALGVSAGRRIFNEVFFHLKNGQVDDKVVEMVLRAHHSQSVPNGELAL